jgi:hypothetical protein
MNYEAKDLPYNQFEKIGMSKREVLAMPSEDLKALLNGRTTKLQTIRIKDQDVEKTMQVKLSVERFPDGSLNLMVHPIRKEIKNDDKLSESQLEKLKQGETLIAPKTSMNGEKELYLYELDRETREIVKTRLNSISVPRYLMDIELSAKDRPNLLQGKTIDLEDRYGKVHKVAIDLIDPKGYSIKNPEQKLEPSISTKEEPERSRGVKR